MRPSTPLHGAAVVLALLIPATAAAQPAPLDRLWTPERLQKIRDQSTLNLEIIPRAGYLEVFFDSEAGDAKWADSEPPYDVHTGGTIRIHGCLATPTGTAPRPALVLGHGHGGHGVASRRRWALQTFLDYFDPIRYAPTQHGALLTIVGSHDQYFTAPAINTTFDAVQSAGTSPRFIKRLFIAPNGKHGVLDGPDQGPTIQPMPCGPPLTPANVIYFASSTDTGGHTASSKLYYRFGEMAWGQGFVPRIEHWDRDDFPIQPAPICSAVAMR